MLSARGLCAGPRPADQTDPSARRHRHIGDYFELADRPASGTWKFDYQVPQRMPGTRQGQHASSALLFLRSFRLCASSSLVGAVVLACSAPAAPTDLRVEPERAVCSVPSSCSTSFDCPRGTVCRPAVTIDPQNEQTIFKCPGVVAASAPGVSPAQNQCVIDDLSEFSASLFNSLAAGRFELTRGENGTFEYDRPPGTSLVECALFSCAPELANEAANGDMRSVITNFDRCVLSYEVSDAASGEFDPSADTYQEPDAVAGSCPTTTPRFSELAVACWAYSFSDLVSVTSLLKVDFSAVSSIAGTGQSVAGCAGGADGLDCVLDPVLGSIGSCFDGMCTERCLSAVECEDSHLTSSALATADAGAGGEAGADAGQGAAAACRWECAKVANSGVGVCREVTP